MLKNLNQKLETISNISVIVLAVLLVCVLVNQFFLAKTPPIIAASRQPTVDPIGQQLHFENVDWSTNKKTVVLYISNTCKFCELSAPFYQRLVQIAQQKNVKVIAVFPQSVSEGQQFLSKHSVSGAQVVQEKLDKIGVKGTPTSLLVDEKGVVTDSWTGKLSESKENELLNKLGI